MSTEELLKPRYKVIADYPESRFKIEVILIDEGVNGFFYNDRIYNKAIWVAIDKYPHIFKRLEWWEDRIIEDLPKYLRHTKYNDDNKVILEVLYYSPNDKPWIAYIKGATSVRTQLNVAIKECQPATEQEYTDYINQLKI